MYKVGFLIRQPVPYESIVWLARTPNIARGLYLFSRGRLTYLIKTVTRNTYAVSGRKVVWANLAGFVSCNTMFSDYVNAE